MLSLSILCDEFAFAARKIFCRLLSTTSPCDMATLVNISLSQFSKHRKNFQETEILEIKMRESHWRIISTHFINS